MVAKVFDPNLDQLLSAKTKTLKQKLEIQKQLMEGVEGAIELKLKAIIDQLLDAQTIQTPIYLIGLFREV